MEGVSRNAPLQTASNGFPSVRTSASAAIDAKWRSAMRRKTSNINRLNRSGELVAGTRKEVAQLHWLKLQQVGKWSDKFLVKVTK